MKTIKTYHIDELPENIQQKIFDEFRDINVEYWEWYHNVDEILKNAGFKLVSFDIYDREIKIDIFEDAYLTALNMIDKKTELTEELVKFAENFCFNWSELVKKYSNGIRLDEVAEDNEYEFDQDANELEKEFIKEIGEETLSMLRNEYEFLTSNDSIFDTIKANEYEFTRGGQFIHHFEEQGV